MKPKLHFKNFIMDAITGESICSCGCGRVAEEKIMDQTTRSITREEGMIQGNNYVRNTRHDYGLTTIIGTKDHTGKSFKGKDFERLMNLQQWHTRTVIANPKERRMANMISMILESCKSMNMSQRVIEESMSILRKAEEKNLVKGNLIKEFSGAVIYLACKNIGHVKGLNEIAKEIDAGRKRIRIYHSILFRELSIENKEFDPKVYVSQIMSRMIKNIKVEKIALEILELAKGRTELLGKNPKSIAAGAIHMACMILYARFSLTKRGYLMEDIETASGITTVTMRHIRQKIPDIEALMRKKYAS